MKYTATLKKNLRYFLIATLSTWAVLTIGYLTPTKWNYDLKQDCAFNIYVSNGGIHTDIIVPVETAVFDWQDHISLKGVGSDAATDYKYLSFSWGDKNFFIKIRTWTDFKLSTALKTLFFPRNSSVMHVKGYRILPSPNDIEIKCVRIGKRDYLKLMEFINNSFQTNESGNKIRVANGYYSYDSFYAAKGNYSILRTCNSWTAEGLRLANVNTPLWAGLSSAVMLQLRSDCTCYESY